MVKIPIAEQIDAVKACHVDRTTSAPGRDEAVEAAIRTLQFVRDHEPEIRYAIARKKALAEAKADPVVNRILDEFPGAEIEGVGEAD